MTERNTGTIPSSAFQDPRIPWCYCVRVDVASPIGTKRFTDGNPLAAGDIVANIDGTGSQTWTLTGIVVNGLDQGKQGRGSVSSVAFMNGDTPPTWATWAASPGLRKAPVQVWRVWFHPDTGAIRGQYKEYSGRVDNQQIGPWAELVLKPLAPLSRESPWLTPVQLGAGALMPDPSLLPYFGDRPQSERGR